MKIWYLIITVLGQPTYIGGPYTADECAIEFVSVILQVGQHEKQGELSFNYKGYDLVLTDIKLECTKDKIKSTKM